MNVLLPDGKTQIQDFAVIRDIAEVPSEYFMAHAALRSGSIEWIREETGLFERWQCHYRTIMTTDGVTYRPEYDTEPQLMEARCG